MTRKSSHDSSKQEQSKNDSNHHNNANASSTTQHRGVRKHQYAPRTSRFDLNDSSIEASEFRGFFNLFGLFLVVFVIAHPMINWYDQGVLVDASLFWSLVHDIGPLLLTWLVFSSWAYTALLLQNLVMMGLPSLLVHVLQHGSQAFLIFFSVWLAFHRDWSIVQTGFVVIQSIVHFMKMHSYTTTNRDLARAAKKASDMSEEQKRAELVYPYNVSFSNFTYYMLCPTLVYEPKYPQIPRFRPRYFFEKCAQTIGCILVLYMLSSQYIVPVLNQSYRMSVGETVARLIVPFILGYLLFFFIVFECILNGFAELTTFADREFYQDWWNSTTLDEYARKWNRPVHEWLLRHVYLETIQEYKVSKTSATVMTFFFSACLHELLLAAVFRMIRPYLFGLMMLQIPLIYLGRLFKGTRGGNLFFWFSLILGHPLLSVLYGREWVIYARETGNF
eukprot:GILI01007140.1.p1 GENE.GILI01007140.1~~GILI01007140.1.p1  ORF type:complete len:447 (-),score=126.18 GILI01007140.1:244-1584(-)